MKSVNSEETVPAPHVMTFHNEKGVEVGRLDFEKEMKFTGNADESAKIFFDHILKGYVDDYIKEQIKKRR